MSGRIPSQYRDMLQQAFKEGSAGPERPLKRRKHRGNGNGNGSPKKKEQEQEQRRSANTLSPSLSGSGSGSSDEVVELKKQLHLDKDQKIGCRLVERRPVDEQMAKDVDGDSGDSGDSDTDSEDEFDSDEFEDVDLDHVAEQSDTINVTIRARDSEGKRNGKKPKRTTVVSKEERRFRKNIHMMYLAFMVAHGVCRNSWCSDRKLLKKLRKQVPNSIINECAMHQKERSKTDVSTQSKTRKLLDLLRHLMVYWYESWTLDTDAPVIFKKGWDELNIPVPQQKMTKHRFYKSIKHHSGSRDIAAQGFASLLRSVGIPARLVISLQPPDFTNLAKLSSISGKKDEEKKKQQQQQQQQSPPRPARKKGANVISQHERLLSNLRGRRTTYTNYKPDAGKLQDKYSNYPVYWVEVWDSAAKRFITVDPIVLKTIEIVSRKSQLEPPATDRRNNAYYVIGFDRLGGVRDITCRYAESFNAKVRKKRITREESGQKWYEEMLRGANTPQRLKPNKIDKFEEIEFEELALKEGMPNSIQDFKGHPVYALEEQLKANEVLKPKISCGTIRKRTRNNKDGVLIPVYRRKNVHTVRSAKAWYMRGRVLKIGQRPLKIREKPKVRKRGKDEDNFELSDGEEEDDVRLYAEYQTDYYLPPAITDGKIPRNAYGNIDVYQPWMVPEGTVHIPDERAEKAAKLMGIEYAPAAVGFDFKGDRHMRNEATVKILGIVTFEEYADAVELLCEGLKDADDEKQRRRDELIALRAWKIVFAKLRITNRLNAELGEVPEEEDTYVPDASDLDSDDSDEEEDRGMSNEAAEEAAGGFMLNDAEGVNEGMYFGDEEGEEEYGGGFVAEEPQTAVTIEDQPLKPKSPPPELPPSPASPPAAPVAKMATGTNDSEFMDFMGELGLDENGDAMQQEEGENVADGQVDEQVDEQVEEQVEDQVDNHAEDASQEPAPVDEHEQFMREMGISEGHAAPPVALESFDTSSDSSEDYSSADEKPYSALPEVITVPSTKPLPAKPKKTEPQPVVIDLSDSEPEPEPPKKSQSTTSETPSIIDLDEVDDEGYEFDYSDTD